MVQSVLRSCPTVGRSRLRFLVFIIRDEVASHQVSEQLSSHPQLWSLAETSRSQAPCRPCVPSPFSPHRSQKPLFHVPPPLLYFPTSRGQLVGCGRLGSWRQPGSGGGTWKIGPEISSNRSSNTRPNQVAFAQTACAIWLCQRGVYTQALDEEWPWSFLRGHSFTAAEFFGTGAGRGGTSRPMTPRGNLEFATSVEAGPPTRRSAGS